MILRVAKDRFSPQLLRSFAIRPAHPRLTVLSALTVLMLLLTSATAQKQEGGSGGADVDVVTDTKGIDIEPYVQKVIKRLRASWYSVIPAPARAPELKSGTTKIEFSIACDGKLNGIRIVESSGDRDLDGAAWTAVSESNPL